MKIFGILNITPDSFSDGGKFTTTERAVEHAKQMVADGASIIDIGAESTRPGAKVISVKEELDRLLHVLQQLPSNIIISIDTRNYETAKEIIKFPNVKYLNDVSGFTNRHMLELAAQHKLTIIAMHSLSVPANKNIVLTTPPLETICQWIKNKSIEFKNYLSADKIIFDPGLGFGKTSAQSKELIEHSIPLTELCHNLGAKILYGHSRKSFLHGKTMPECDCETAEISKYLQKAGVDYIRVHNVAMNAQAILEKNYKS